MKCEVLKMEMEGNVLTARPCCAEAVAVYAWTIAGSTIQILAVCKDHLKRDVERMLKNEQNFNVKFMK